MTDYTIIIDSKDYGVIEDLHSMIMHSITDYFKKTMIHNSI